MEITEYVLDYLRSKGEIPADTEEEIMKYEYLDAGLVDSMEIVEMITVFEKEFDIFFEPETMQSVQFRTIGGLIEIIDQLIKGGKK